MNYLAHIYLSAEDEKVLIGNFIADSVKGKKYLSYDSEIQKGIIMHRKIDWYTDQHPLVNKVAAHFSPLYGKYAYVVCDIVFDHFLALNWNKYHHTPLNLFVDQSNKILLRYFYVMPLKMKLMLPFWIKNRWPEMYATISGIERVLLGMSRYTSLPNQSKKAANIIINEHHTLETYFFDFFSELKVASKAFLF